MTAPGMLVVGRGSRAMVVAPPDSDATVGRFSVAMAATLARARASRRTAAFLPASSAWRADWFRAAGGPEIAPLRGHLAAWARLRWGMARAREQMAGANRRARLVWSRELHRELRRQAGNDRLPSRTRTRFKNAARRSLGWAPADPARQLLPRRLLRDAIPVTLTDAAHAEADRLAAAAGLQPTAPIVAFEVPPRAETAMPSIAYLTALGYLVVRVGDDAAGPLDISGVCDVAGRGRSSPLLDISILLHARFLVCRSMDWQHAAYLTNTPTLRFDAPDPFAAYPVRADGLLLLARAIDLESGRPLNLEERLSAAYFAALRNIGHAPASAAELSAATREMHERLSAAAEDAPGQAAFRARVARAAEELAPQVPYVAEWGADHGFVGDGRLARVQAIGASA